MTFAIKENEDLQELINLNHLMLMASPSDEEGRLMQPQAALENMVVHFSRYVEKRAIAMEKLRADYNYAEAIQESAIKFHNGEKFH